MTNARELAESDLGDTLEDPKGWGLPIVLIDPDGGKQELNGQVLYNSFAQDPTTGAEVLVPKPVAVVRKSSLTRIPLPTEKKWAMMIPREPRIDADKITYSVETPIYDCSSIGFVRLYGTRIIQEAP